MSKKQPKNNSDSAYIKAIICIVAGVVFIIVSDKIFNYSEYANYTNGSSGSTTSMALVIKGFGGLLLLIGTLIVIARSIKGKL